MPASRTDSSSARASPYPPPSSALPPIPNDSPIDPQHQIATHGGGGNNIAFRGFVQQLQDRDVPGHPPYPPTSEQQIHRLQPKHQLDPSSFAGVHPAVQQQQHHQHQEQQPLYYQGSQQQNPTPISAPGGSATKGRKRSLPIGESPKVTKRIFQACEKCREMKAKCDGKKPTCSHCSARGLICTYASERRMRGPNKKREPGEPVPKRRQSYVPRGGEEHPDVIPGGYQYPTQYSPEFNPSYHTPSYRPQYLPQPPYSSPPYPPQHEGMPGPSNHHMQGQGPPYPTMDMPMDMSMQMVPVDHSMYGEPIPPQEPVHVMEQPYPDDVYPTVHEFGGIIDTYLNSLYPKNRERSLLSQATYDRILYTLIHGDADAGEDPGAIDSAQFRAWVRKNFAAKKTDGGVDVVVHNDKPVAVQEQMYTILLHCHSHTRHGGREKTAAMVNEHYSWIPKALIDAFIKSCPGCPRKVSAASKGREGNSRGAGPNDHNDGGSDNSEDEIAHQINEGASPGGDVGHRESDEGEGYGEGSPGEEGEGEENVPASSNIPSKGRGGRYSTRANLKTSNVRGKPHPTAASATATSTKSGVEQAQINDRMEQQAHQAQGQLHPENMAERHVEQSGGSERVEDGGGSRSRTLRKRPGSTKKDSHKKVKGEEEDGQRGQEGVGGGRAEGRRPDVQMEDLVKVADLVMHEGME